MCIYLIFFILGVVLYFVVITSFPFTDCVESGSKFGEEDRRVQNIRLVRDLFRSYVRVYFFPKHLDKISYTYFSVRRNIY